MDAPRNVRLVCVSPVLGTFEQPVKVAYVGLDKQGRRQFMAFGIPPDLKVVSIRADWMPPNATLGVRRAITMSKPQQQAAGDLGAPAAHASHQSAYRPSRGGHARGTGGGHSRKGK